MPWVFRRRRRIIRLMQKIGRLLLLTVVLSITACGGDSEPISDAGTVVSSADATVSSQKSVVPPGFPRSIGVSPETLSELLKAELTVADPSVRRLLTEAREPFRFTLNDGKHAFSARLRSIGLTRAVLRRDFVVAGNVTGDEADEVVALVQYENDASVIASEVLVLGETDGGLSLVESMVLADAEPIKIGVANGEVRVRARLRGETVDMTLKPRE
jgi:hypothetical protein